jgi:hypothetical protein
MSTSTPCYRHPRNVWLASCDDCTAWHLAAAIARRDRASASPESRHVAVLRPPLPPVQPVPAGA